MGLFWHKSLILSASVNKATTHTLFSVVFLAYSSTLSTFT